MTIEDDINAARERAAQLDPGDSRFLTASALLNDADTYVVQARGFVARALTELASDPAEFTDDDGLRIVGIHHEPVANTRIEL
jgi:hypothetical protein